MNKVLALLQPLKKWIPQRTVAADSRTHCALDLGCTRLLYVEGSLTHAKIHLERLEIVPINADSALALNKLFDEKKCNRNNIHMSLKSPHVVTRILRFPKMTEKELRGVLQFEIEQYVPYESKNLYLDMSVLQESIATPQGEVTEIFVAVAQKDHLDSVIKQLQEVQSNLESVYVDMLACMRCLEFFHPAESSGHTAVLDMGVQLTTLGIVRSGKPRFIRDLSFGSRDIAKKIKTRISISDQDIQGFVEGKWTVPADQTVFFNESIANLINDVKVSFDYYRDQSEDASTPDKLIVCGIGSGQAFILAALQQALNLPVHPMDLASKIECGAEVHSETMNSIAYDLPVVLGLLLNSYD